MQDIRQIACDGGLATKRNTQTRRDVLLQIAAVYRFSSIERCTLLPGMHELSPEVVKDYGEGG